ncbi:hypothetical protein HOY80DRAFT_8498 [Tuber brumale]|nr:hypothetical protein HOY80DRAFT_8498 [Tuber brumale]
MFSASFTSGLETGIISGKAAFKPSDKPQLIEALRFTICCKPSGVRCSFRFMIFTTCLNNSKSACFFVINGYFSK